MKNIISLLMLVVLASCQPSQNINDEVSVIQSTFYKATTMMAQNAWKDMQYNTPKFLPGTDTATYIAKPKGYVNKMGTPIYFMKDTLSNMTEFNLGGKSKYKSPLVNQLLKSKLKEIHVVFKEMPQKYLITKHRMKYNENGNYNGDVHFSRVVFNNDKTRACYYLGQYYNMNGRGWGMGVFVIAKKVNNSWLLESVIDDWIS